MKYLIVYTFTMKDGRSGNGNYLFEFEDDVTFEVVREIEAQIKAENDFEAIVITNWKVLD